MKKFISLAFCAVAAGIVVFKMHSQAAVASSQAVGNAVAVQSANGNTAQQDSVVDKVKKANRVIIPASKGRLTTPELTLEQAKVLEGTITNQYGIRDDVYEYIQTHIPNENQKAIKAAIKYAQYDDQIYYHSATKKEALDIHKKKLLALTCLDLFSPKDGLNIAKGISHSMRNTTARNQRRWDIDEKYFGWEVLGTGLTDSEEKKKCEIGAF